MMTTPTVSKAAAAQLRALTNLVRKTGSRLAALQEKGGLTETTKWGQTAFLPARARVGTTVRVDVHDDQHTGLYVHCQTDLVDRYRGLYPHLAYSGNRAVLFDIRRALPRAEIEVCVELALLYHLHKRLQS